MGKKEQKLLFVVVPAIFLASAFLYIVFIVRPVLIYHHVQPPFLLDSGFLTSQMYLPGDFARLLANFIMQFFQYRFAGPVVFFAIAVLTGWLIYILLNSIHQSRINVIPALLLLSFQVILSGNYNLPFSVHLSVLIVLLGLILFAKHRKGFVHSMVFYIMGALGVYYLCGSGYLLLFSAGAILLSPDRKTGKPLILILVMLVFAVWFPWFAHERLFALPGDYTYLYFFPREIYFKACSPSPVLYGYLLLIPSFILVAQLFKIFYVKAVETRRAIFAVKGIPYLLYLLLAGVVFLAHTGTFSRDAGSIVASDYYCSVNNFEQAAATSRSIQEYSFQANFTHNLALLKSGRLSKDFFDFFQISGTDALYPDCEFLPERSFFIADFYYQLGFITEARHWAYESLVYYPYSQRAMQMLVKVHLVTREYKAAAKYLNLLSKGMTNKNFVREYRPLVQDTLLAGRYPEIAERRSFIPEEKELSPFVDQRFRELLAANPGNRGAYECLMLFYLLDGQLENFISLYQEAGNFFSAPVEMYEEAVLMYGEKTNTEVITRYNITPAVISRYHEFLSGVARAGGEGKKARDLLFRDFGNSYMYYLKFIYPRIIKPEIIPGSDEEQPI